MTDEQNSKCHKIIHTAAASASAIGFGLAQIPGSDTIPITALQVGMIIGLGSVFGMDISEAAAKSILGAGLAAIGGRTVSQILVGWLPGIGNGINAATAFTITETLGWKVANDFSEEAEKQAEAERLAREKEKRQAQKEAEKKARAERLAREEAERKAREAEGQAKANAEKTAEQPSQTILQKEASIQTQAKENSYSKHILMCVVFSLVLFAACMLSDLLLEKFTLHFKIWGTLSGIILAVLVNAVIFIICKNKGWQDKSTAVMAYSNYLAVVIDVVCALVTSSGKDVHGWDEAIVAFFKTPLLNCGLVIIAAFWWLRVIERILDDWKSKS